MNELIPITTNETGEPVVSGRMLHGFLGAETRYNDWFARKYEYGFSESEDYLTLLLSLGFGFNSSLDKLCSDVPYMLNHHTYGTFIVRPIAKKAV
jgi:hypothetical protein